MAAPPDPTDGLRIEIARLSDVVADLSASVRELRRTTTQEALELKARSHALNARLTAVEQKGAGRSAGPAARRKAAAATSPPSKREAAATTTSPPAKTEPDAAAQRRAKVAEELKAEAKRATKADDAG